jgi:hypothetical protein
VNFKELLDQTFSELEALGLLESDATGIELKIEPTRLSIKGDVKDISPSTRQQIKRKCELELAGYPGFRYLQSYKIREGGLRVIATLMGTYECRPDGYIETEASADKLESARQLEEMTPDEALAWAKSEAARLREPQRISNYTCEPVALPDGEDF